MSHVVLANQAPPDTFNVWMFAAVYKLTRALKKAGWKVLASSDGTTKDTTGLPQNDKWGAGVSLGSGTGASITTKTGTDMMTVTGLTGLSTTAFGGSAGGSEGDFITFTGCASAGNNTTAQIIQVLSATSCIVRNSAGVASDANNGAISWNRKDPTLDLLTGPSSGYASSTVTLGGAAWICMQGPSTLKVPFSVAPTGTFLRGEKVTQAGTNAEGELVGITWDPSTGAGWAVILPRVTGTGAGQRGWDQNGSATYAITGASSGATFNPNGAIDEFVREVVFWRDSSTPWARGHSYWAVVSVLNEPTQRFSYVAANSAGCTATVAPGGGGTNNTLAYFSSNGVFGMHGQLGGGTSSYWTDNNNNGAATGNIHVIAANCIERPGLSADGSFIVTWCAIGSAPDNYEGFLFQRLDDSEDGDVDPFVWWTMSHYQAAYNVGGGYNTTYLKNGNMGTTSDWNNCWGSNMLRCDRGQWKATRRRGLTNDALQFVGSAVLKQGWVYASFWGALKTSYTTAVTDPEKTASNATATLVREPIWFANQNTSLKCRKGTMRWIYLIDAGVCLDTWDSKKWVMFRTTFWTNANSSDGLGLALGPWDGVSTPVSAPYMS